MVAETEPQQPLKREFSSTLIEFPKRKNNNEAEWRDSLRERVRAARERRDGIGESGELVERKVETARPKAETVATATVVNLKPNAEPKATNSIAANNILARALERVERSRQVHQSGAAAVALAPVFEPQEMPAPKPQAAAKPAVSLVPASQPTSEAQIKPAPRKIEMPVIDEGVNISVLTENTSAQVLKVETAIKPLETGEVGVAAPAPKKEPRKLAMISDADADQFIESQTRISAAIPQKKPSPRSGIIVEQEVAPRFRENAESEIIEDYAPLFSRFAAALIDAILCAGATAGLFSLFAPAGYFTPEKFDLNSLLTIVGVFATIKFLYLTAAIVLAETTFGGYVFRLRTVHAEDGSAATVFEAMLNSLGYLTGLALAGLGLISILLSTERRAFHDLIAGTVVIRQS
jgi:uncharacterized RDD family membrane protein YckC